MLWKTKWEAYFKRGLTVYGPVLNCVDESRGRAQSGNAMAHQAVHSCVKESW